MFDEVFAFLKTKVFANGTHKHIAIIDLVRYGSEGELPYRPYSGALHEHENCYRRFSTISSYYQYTSSRLKNAHEISAKEAYKNNLIN